MINIRSVIRGGINTINPDMSITILQSDGFEVLPGGLQAPKYLKAQTVTAQVQPVPSEELKHINNYNVSSIYYDIYINGSWHGLNRADMKGGDLVYFNGFEWLTISLPENFSLTSTWTKIRVIQQNPKTAPVAT